MKKKSPSGPSNIEEYLTDQIFEQIPGLQGVLPHLQNLFQKHSRITILGVGENRMGDDGVGPWISFHLSQKLHNPNVLVINGGIVPEERLDEIVEFQPDLILIIDAAEIDVIPGGIGLYNEKSLLNYLPVSSHTLPLPVFIDRLKQNIEGVEIYLLGIRPIQMEFLDRYELFDEEHYSLDDKEANPNIPFYAFNLSEKIEKLANHLIEILALLLSPEKEEE